MQFIHRLKRWYSFNRGRGREMLAAGATPRQCPHCGVETPVYRSSYDRTGSPVSFSVCLWCDGFIELDDLSNEPREPYATPTELRVNHADRPDRG